MHKTKKYIPLSLALILFISFKIPSKKCDEIPQLNKSIIGYVTPQIGKQVGRGECWDLAAAALDTVRANWDGLYGFGGIVNDKKECVYPGDIIQFEKVVLKYLKEGTPYEEKFPHHTAIIYKVNAKGNFILAHQNTAYNGKNVVISPLNVDNIIRGKYSIYRPIN